MEAGMGYTPKSWLKLSGYAGRQWSGNWDAGVRGTIAWGR
jgi:hypothetical protein